MERGSIWIGKCDLDVGIVVFQAECSTDKRSARSDSGDKPIHLAVGIAPDFLRRGFDMGLPVDRIIELIGPYRTIGFAFGKLLGQSSRQAYIIVRISIRCGWNFNQFGAKQAQGVLLSWLCVSGITITVR